MFRKLVMKQQHKHKIFATFLFSYVVILIIPLIAGSMIYLNVNKVVQEQENYSRLAMLRQVSSNIESRFQEINTMAINIATNQSIQSFISVRKDLGEDGRYLVFSAINNLKPYRNSNDFVKDFYIYFKNSDVILTPNNMSSPEYFYENVYSYDDYDFDDWYDNILHGEYKNIFLPAQGVEGNPWSKRIITIMQPIPIMEKKDPSAILFILVEEDKIKSIVEELSMEGSIYIMDENDRIIFESATTDLFDELDLDLYDDDELISNYRYDEQDFVITNIRSSHEKWRFLYITPQSIFMEKANKLQTTVAWYVGICLLFGLTVSYLMAYRNYSPIKQIVEFITAKRENGNPIYVNELDFIKRSLINVYNENSQLAISFDEVSKENEKFMDKFRKNMYLLKNTFISDLIKGRINDYEIVNSLLSFYKMEFASDRFAIILFQTDKYNPVNNNKISQEITAIVEKSFTDQLNGYVAEMENDRVALLANIKNNYEYEDIIECLQEISIKIKDYIYESQKNSLIIGIGDISIGFKGIELSYKQAKQALEYKIIEGSKSIFLYKEVMSKREDNRRNYFYPIKIEQKLVNFAKSGDIGQCKSILNKIFDENYNNRNLDARPAKWLLFNILSTALKILDEIGLQYSDLPGIDIDSIDSLLSSESFYKAYLNIVKLYEGICLNVNDKKLSHNEILKCEIIKYIETHYCNPDISQSQIAEYLGITPQYLSRFFKQETGENMVEYINRLRIEKAKNLLSEKDLSILNVSEMVGYGNDRNLNRVFKQREGITPGKYRESILRANE